MFVKKCLLYVDWVNPLSLEPFYFYTNYTCTSTI